MRSGWPPPPARTGPPPEASPATCGSAPAPGGCRPWSPRARCGRCWRGGSTSPSRTSGRRPCRRCATASSSTSRPRRRASPRTSCSPSCWIPSRPSRSADPPGRRASVAAPGPTSEALGLPPGLLAALDRLTFRSRRPVPGDGAGQRISPRPGASAEFSDYRTYVPGDDFRRVDWNAYARLDRLMLKLYLGEEDVSIHIFVDTSDSMRWGQPGKDGAARSIAAALAYVGLAGLDRGGGTGFADRVTATPPPQRGRQSSPPLRSTLPSLGSAAARDFATPPPG